MKSSALVPALAILLSGCGGTGGASGGNAAAPAAPATPDPVEVKIRALNPVQQKIAFFRAIYDADYTCKKIVSVVEKPRSEGHPVWLVTCDDHGEYVITLIPGGTFSVSGVPQPKGRFPNVRPSASPR